jgi:hypothetical protein
VGRRLVPACRIPAATPRQGSRTSTSGLHHRDIIDYIVQGIAEGFDRDVVIPQNSLQAEIIRGAA